MARVAEDWVELENDFCRLRASTALGGRILEILDKRTGTWIIQPNSEVTVKGVSLSLDGGPRKNESGPIDWLAEEENGLWIAESAHGSLSFHLRIELPEDRAEITLEARVLNRSFEAVHYNGGLIFGPELTLVSSEGAEHLMWHDAAEAGLLVRSEELAEFPTRFPNLRSMAPRQLDTWSATLTPISGLGPEVFVGNGLALSLEPDRVRVSSSMPRPAYKLVLDTTAGPLEAKIDIPADRVFDVPLTGSTRGAKAAAIRSPNRETVVSTAGTRNEQRGTRNEQRGTRNEEPEELGSSLSPEISHADLDYEGFSWPLRAQAEALKGLRALAKGEPAEASARFEQALMYNAEDHLVWWAKAAAERLAGSEIAERPELLNAHYLAPLEPILRAEAFLSQPMTQSAEPNPLLKSFDAQPANFVEVACLLIEAGLLADASRWIDEALRHVDLAMLRYLLAYCLLKGSRMRAEAAIHITAAARLGNSPPHPFRRIERIALEALGEAFPEDDGIAGYLALSAARLTTSSSSTRFQGM